MGSWKKWATLIAFVVVPGAGALAADPSSLPPLMRDAPFPVDEYSTGWYLRGDVGYRINSVGVAHVLFPPNPINNRIGDSANFGGGLGFKSGWFRADFTADYGGSRYFGDTAVRGDYSLRVDAITGLVNGYIDLGTWYRITPYIGAGFGASYIHGLEFMSQSRPNNLQTPPGGNWNFAWAAMAGFSYPLTTNLLLDVGYRFLALGEIESDIDSRQNMITIRDFTSHELRAGLRFTFD
jgi:opacity protein-like surface antigen